MMAAATTLTQLPAALHCKPPDLPSLLSAVGGVRICVASRWPFVRTTVAEHFGALVSSTSSSQHKIPLILSFRLRRRCGRWMDWKAYRWGGRIARRCQQRSFTRRSLSSDHNSPADENFWDQAEGKKKLGEIEDMKELVSDASKLQSGEDQKISQGNAGCDVSEKEQAQKLSEELARKAKEQAERRKQAEQMFQLGQRAYGRGMYDKSVEFLEAALTNIPGASNLGGEVQLWLAMAYEANYKHTECIALYKKLESSHPSRSVRKQAKDLRYILEAPKLKISKEEMVSIPLIDDNFSNDTRTWSKMYKERKKKTSKKTPSSPDYLADWLVWKPPRWERSPYFWVAVTIWLTLVGISLMFQD